jgi:acetyl-CoA carboxylase biotin carboxyl carrier protein
VSDLGRHVDELVALMDEFGLRQAKMKGADWAVELSMDLPATGTVLAAAPAPASEAAPAAKAAKGAAPAVETGAPISSPMTGIYYSSPSPGEPAFIGEGDTVTAGQVIGLIEAMKVFNEITATVSGKVTKILVENGQLVHPGDVLVRVG